ncbi:SMI1/KNR4 family protein [Actinomadura logoneensis]|uniref:SMI1/KNR4 family protein n=1 Tax=Actinomadura logoneensis TaxID=2293572 RepID=A0A372JPQ1_9ACTN|nr:SMI1/KNR4 family protein [Actinomadura logoneensis]RFU41987.1 SMI1/KNR4 family protein [Actinomadura logoneensis]
MPALEDFATWEPLLRLVRDGLGADGSGRASGFVGQGSWSVPVPRPAPVPGRAAQVSDMQAEWDAVELLRDSLGDLDGVSFVADIEPDGRTTLHLIKTGPAADHAVGSASPGELVFVEGAVPEPWRRLPEPSPGAVPAPTADAELLERTLRERLPAAIGATDEEIAAAETRLGVALPAELKALYRVTRAVSADLNGDYAAMSEFAAAVRCELFPLDELYIADAASRPAPWRFAAGEAVVTRPDDAVQGVVGSPGWIAFGDNGGGDRYALDLTPGPRGHLGQVVLLSHEEGIGAELIADSLTDMIVHDRESAWRPSGEPSRAVAHVNVVSLPSIEAAAHPELEVLHLGVWEDEPMSLAPVFGCPRLRTLTAYAGTLADPLEIERLEHLEYLALAPDDWRVLLDADAVPRTLLAAGFEGYQHDPLELKSLANELLAQRQRPQITETVLEGVL